MTMAMQVDRPPGHVPPSAERVVAKHKPRSINGDFGIWLNALPAIALGDSRIVVVADHEMLAPIQHLQQECYTLCWLSNGEIAQMPNFISWFDHSVPPIDQHLIHLAN
jgi:hypothetical protein